MHNHGNRYHLRTNLKKTFLPKKKHLNQSSMYVLTIVNNARITDRYTIRIFTYLLLKLPEYCSHKHHKHHIIKSRTMKLCQ